MGDTYSRYCAQGESEGRIRNPEKGVRGRFGGLEPCQVAVEAGKRTWWICRLLSELGHEAVVADTRRVRALSRNERARPLVQCPVFPPRSQAPVSPRNTARRAFAAGFRLPSQSMTELFAGQGKQSWPIQMMKPPQRGKRPRQAAAAMR